MPCTLYTLTFIILYMYIGAEADNGTQHVLRAVADIATGGGQGRGILFAVYFITLTTMHSCLCVCLRVCVLACGYVGAGVGVNARMAL